MSLNRCGYAGTGTFEGGAGGDTAFFFSDCDEKMAAVAAAPVAAEIPAMMARVVFDMLIDLGEASSGHQAGTKPFFYGVFIRSHDEGKQAIIERGARDGAR